jgi:hypothetical protein
VSSAPTAIGSVRLAAAPATRPAEPQHPLEPWQLDVYSFD